MILCLSNFISIFSPHDASPFGPSIPASINSFRVRLVEIWKAHSLCRWERNLALHGHMRHRTKSRPSPPISLGCDQQTDWSCPCAAAMRLKPGASHEKDSGQVCRFGCFQEKRSGHWVSLFPDDSVFGMLSSPMWPLLGFQAMVVSSDMSTEDVR